MTPTTTSHFFRLLSLLEDRKLIRHLPSPNTTPTLDTRKEKGGYVDVARNYSGFASAWAKVDDGDFIMVQDDVPASTMTGVYLNLRQAPRGSSFQRLAGNTLKRRREPEALPARRRGHPEEAPRAPGDLARRAQP